ncbi:MAG: hypothetical protein D6744_07365 [Planctomycetota bacterium]|nr:MAG: hypothetical protein D6744_07365 [Planctomycetota bacterium]
MAFDAVTLAVLGAGGALALREAARDDGADKAVEQIEDAGVPAAPKIVPIKATLRLPQTAKAGASHRLTVAHPGIAMQMGVDVPGRALAHEQGVIDREIQEVEREMREEYERMSREARREAARRVNEQLGTNLTGDESFEEAAAIIGGAAAAAGCTATGLGSTVASLCAMAGAYFGREIGEWLKDKWDGAKDAIEDAWNETKDWVSGLF